MDEAKVLSQVLPKLLSRVQHMDILTQILSNRAMLERLKSYLHKVLHKAATMKINDWVSLQEGFDEIDKQLDKLVRNRRVVRLRHQNKHLNPEFD